MNRLRIVIADDDKSLRVLYEKGLSNEQFEKRFAANGKEALDLYRQWKPDIMLLDVFMPVMTGYSVLKEIREKQKDSATVIIMATSLSSREDIRDCVSLGIQGYLMKPISHREISAYILSCVQEAKSTAG
jgi:two-component system, OmpR family, alkaline phosphatase synthesis response regulator PhoP